MILLMALAMDIIIKNLLCVSVPTLSVVILELVEQKPRWLFWYCINKNLFTVVR